MHRVPLKVPSPMHPAEQQDGLHYATVHFSKKPADPVYSNTGPAQPGRYDEDETIVYAAVRFNAAASRTGVVQGTNRWGVTYSSQDICASRGSTVTMSCTFKHPSSVTITHTCWHSKDYFNNRCDYNYRETHICDDKNCTLSIIDLKDSDAATYKFRLIGREAGDKFTGDPGVTLTVTALQMHVTRVTVNVSHTEAELRCTSTCAPSYVWFKNGLKVPEEAASYTGHLEPGDGISCALKGHEDHPVPSLYAPKFPSVSVSPSEVMEGSSVNLTCSSDANIVANYTWYKRNDKEPVSEEPQLVFSSIQSSDSGQYYCRAENQLGTRETQICIDVKYAPKNFSVSVSPSAEIVEGSSVTLTCSSDANPAASYTWYKENQTLLQGPEGVHRFTSISSEDGGIYYCKSENKYGWINSSDQFIDVQYGPKRPSVSVSASAEIVEGSSVTLTCSSDANPAASYTWYKENQTRPHGEGGIYRFTSISSEDGGIYYCKSENKHGWIDSSSLVVDVQYGPKLPSVSVSPSAEIVEGSSVTLTCSSDANPAANYTWYKENQTTLSEEPQLVFSSIQSSDSGQYYCRAENQLGKKRSEFISVDVKYGPKLPSVSVSPSAEIVEGSSVTLTCSSDANPAASYTWYKEDEDSPKASGQIFIITDIRAEHSGSYSCEAVNMRGRSNSTLHVIVVAVHPEASTSAVIGTTSAVFLAIIGLSVFLLMRKKRATKQSSEPVEGPHNRQQCLPNEPVQRDDIHYASIHFANQTDPVYSNLRPARLRVYEEVEYAAVKFKSASASQG
ncbi:B-cell receptor CD22-like [Lycodopsis pacificus]